MTFEFKGFAQGLLSGEAFSQIEAELESAVKDKEAPPTAEAAATLGAGGEHAVGGGSVAATAVAATVVAGGAAEAPPGEVVARLARLEAKLAEKTELCAEKDAQIAATLEEGERLSIKQAEQEKTIRKLRQAARDAQAAADHSAAELTEVRAELERSSRLHVERESAAAGETAELRAEAVTRAEAAEAEREAERAELTALAARHEALAESHRTLSATLSQAEAREAAAVLALQEVHVENERLMQAGRWRDEGLTSQLGESCARKDAAEAHAAELAASVTRATKPLLRQVSQLQVQQQQITQAAAATEASLRARLVSAEALAERESAGRRQASASLDEMNARVAGLAAQLEAAEEKRDGERREAVAAAVALQERVRALSDEVEAATQRTEEALASASRAAEANAAASARADEATALLSREREAHMAEAREWREWRAKREAEEARATSAAARAAAGVALDPTRRGTADGDGGCAAANAANGAPVASIGGATGALSAVAREMRHASARQQEGELVATRKLVFQMETAHQVSRGLGRLECNEPR